jgi:hypothetical protein
VGNQEGIVTNREHLALMAQTELASEAVGDESGGGDGSDPILLLRMELEIRFRRIEKQLKALHRCPEITAMLARMENRRTYG